MKREIYMLEHHGRLVTWVSVFVTRKTAERMAKDESVLNSLRPARTLKVFAPEQYERALADWRPPTVVRFVESSDAK